ncbi:protein NYNRIN-like [Eulemur rufifrons]|uniref:protein NYNRIN-like n=1 Tax=Eulemur rufifrons TaxID=859984 RepID=UPI003743C283
MPQEARVGIMPHIRRLLDAGILRRCQSAWNTPLLPVRKPGGKDYRPVQDLREVNARVLDIHPTVPNPYTLLSSLPPTQTWYTVLDLKDAFFSLAVAPRSQEIFAFEWQDEERGIRGQLTWTRLPQGFKNSPTLFNEALHEDLDPGPATPEHSCLEILAETQMARKDLQDRPLANSDLTWFTDGSSFVREGHRYAGAAIVDGQGNLIWAARLPQGTSAQKAELIALTEALRRAQGKRLTVYTDSRYAFGTVHIHGALYKERGFITAEGKEIKHKPEILQLLEAILLPKAVAVVHTPGHQKGDSLEARGNRAADAEAKRAAEGPTPTDVLHLSLPPPGMGEIPPQPDYSSMDMDWAREKLQATQGKDGWFQDREHRLVVPEALGNHLLRHLHQTTHLGKKKMLQLLDTAQLRFKSQGKTAESIVKDCRVCQVMQPGRIRGTHAGTRERGRRPGLFWEIDFTEVRPGKYGYKYLLVMVDTFSGWVEAFPTKRETALIVAKKMLEEIVPRYGLPESIGSDNGPAFTSQVSQGLARALGADWKLHCAYNPQSSGQVERMNRTLKETLTKLVLETGGDWVTLLPFALFRARNTPYHLGLTPFEIVYGAPPPVIPKMKPETLPEHPIEVLQAVQALQRVQSQIWPALRAIYQVTRPAGEKANGHPYQPGDWVWVKRHNSKTLEPRWKGPFQTILVTPTALKVDGVATWVHHSHVRPANEDEREQQQVQWRASADPENPLKTRLTRVTTRPPRDSG